MLPSKKPKRVRLKTSAMLTLCVLSLMGCGATLPTCPSESAVLPVRPSISTPLPSQGYSSAAYDDIQSWRRELMATPLMSKP